MSRFKIKQACSSGFITCTTLSDEDTRESEESRPFRGAVWLQRNKSQDAKVSRQTYAHFGETEQGSRVH